MYEKYLELLKEKNCRNIDVSKATGIPPSTFSDWKKGKSSPKLDKLKKIADYFDVQVEYLTGEAEYRTKSDWLININKNEEDILLGQYGLQPIDIHKIPLLGSVACGEPIFASEDRELYVEVGTDIKADYCLTAKGDSMINARINDGDIVFIQRTDSINNGEIGVVLIDNDVTLKRIYYYPNDNKLILQAENSKYEPMVYLNNELDKIRIIGKAIAFQSDII
jgi:SOS-response transcriptional repressors (recA-mediated autopeptidases)